MKLTALALIVCSLSASAYANNAKCRLVSLAMNTHPDVACPEFVAFCTQELTSGDMSIEARGGAVMNFRFLGEERRNHSDVGGEIFNAYTDDNGMYMEVRFQTDGMYPVSRTGDYTDMTLSTGVRGTSGVYTSQLCSYTIN